MPPMPSGSPAGTDAPAYRLVVVSDADGPFEATRLAGLLAAKVAGATALAFRPAQAAGVYRRLAGDTRRWPGTVVHAFGGLSLAVALLAGNAPIAYTAARPPTPRDLAWVRSAMRYRPVTVVCDSDAERRRWVTGGVPPGRCVLVRPGVSLAMPPDARDAARRRFGYSAGHRVLFSPLPAAGASRSLSLWTGSLLHVLKPDTRTIAWNPPGGRDLASLRSRLIDPSTLHVLQDPTPDAGFAAADAVLLPPGDVTSPTVMAMAMASGKPVVATATPKVCEMLEDRHTALLSRDMTPKSLAGRLLELGDDPARARQIGDRARAETYDLFLVSRMIGDYRNVYASLAANAAEEPNPAPSSGIAGPARVRGRVGRA